MKLLDVCLELKRELNDIEEEIEEVRLLAKHPKAQRITGMPRGGGIGNQAESYILKLEKLEDDKTLKKNKLRDTWVEAKTILKSHDARTEYIYLMWLRFYCGYQWKICNDIMKDKYPSQNWNINKCFRVYRSIVKMCDNS